LLEVTDHLSSIVVAIPVKDEVERIGNCLRALSQQSGISRHQIVLLLNNCTDDTAVVVRNLTPNLAVPIHQFEVTLPPEQANAGYARRLAMQAAEKFVAPQGVLLTTDADACVYPDWISANLLALRQGADAVAGCIEIDPAEAALIPPKLHEDDARECAYAALLDEIEARLDWDSADPWPRHSEHSGASIAVTVDATGGPAAFLLWDWGKIVLSSGHCDASTLAFGTRSKLGSSYRGEWLGVRLAAWRIYHPPPNCPYR
jgi:hypothetical protein